LYANSGGVNLFGGSGDDQYSIHDSYLAITNQNKSARIIDFNDQQDVLLSSNNFSPNLINQLAADGLLVNQLSNGPPTLTSSNYREISLLHNVVPNAQALNVSNNQNVLSMQDVNYHIDGMQVSLSDLIQQAQLYN
jgi:hypothetical protein